VWSWTRDEGRPLASGDQAQDANRCKLLPSRAVVVSVAERAGQDPAWVRSGETSESEPLMKRRNRRNDVKTGISVIPGSVRAEPWRPARNGIRYEDGVTPDQALVRNVGTCRRDAKGTVQVGGPGEDHNPDARHRGGAARSSDEGSVMELERRGSSIPPWRTVNR